VVGNRPPNVGHLSELSQQFSSGAAEGRLPTHTYNDPNADGNRLMRKEL
jgi:hypothetical protein